MKYFALLFTAMMAIMPAIVLADAAPPILYSRTSISIERKKLPVLPWQDRQALSNIGNSFDVEVRDASVLYHQEGWFDLSGLSGNSGLLLLFTQPAIAPIAPSTQYAPLDILMIDQQGKIIQIAPNIVLSELKEAIYPTKPILAFLFLKGGTCSALSITPGDEVEYDAFKKPPLVLGTGGAIPPAPAAVILPAAQATPYVDVGVKDAMPAIKTAKRKPAANPLPVLPALPDSAPPTKNSDALQNIINQGNPMEKNDAASTATLDNALKQ